MAGACSGLPQWRNISHRLRFDKMRKRVMDRAFMAKPALCDAILSIRTLVTQLGSTSAVR